MSHPRYTSDEIAQRGQALYDQILRKLHFMYWFGKK